MESENADFTLFARQSAAKSIWAASAGCHTHEKRKNEMLCGAPVTIAGPLSLSQRRLSYTENGQIRAVHAIVTAAVLRCAAVNNIISVYTVHGVQSEF